MARGRNVKVTDLVGVHEVAERLDVAAPSVHVWRQRGVGFPEPAVRLAMGYVWAWPDVEAWARAHGRLDDQGVPVHPKGGRPKGARP